MTIVSFLLTHTPLFYLTQSLWRDEAFSVLFAARPVLSFFTVTFEPPTYYMLLHFWMKIFGDSEIAARSLSLLGFAAATVVMIHWSEKLFKKHWLSWYLPVFFFFNPMLLYYAFEVRAYGWYVFFATLSMYGYMERKWRLYVLATVLGFYTHTYMVIVPVMQVIHYVFMEKKWRVATNFSAFIRDPMVRSSGAIALLISPWLIHVLLDLSRLKSSWYFPVDVHLIKSVLGNIFLGYEGTPGGLWTFTAGISLLILLAAVWSLIRKKNRRRNAFPVIMAIVPLVIIIGISFIKPLFVNRYVIPATVAEILMIVFAIENIKHPLTQKLIALFSLLFILSFNSWYPAKHAKLDSRNTILQINRLMGPNDVILVDNPLIYFETIYYSRDRSRVFFYNPANSPFPWYVGDAIVSKDKFVTDLPPYPIRAFIVHANGTYEMSYNTNK